MNYPTYRDCAKNFHLWQEYTDPSGEYSREEFESLDLDEKISIMIEAFGEETNDTDDR